MDPVFLTALAAFVGHLLLGLVLVGLFIGVFTWLTPLEEIRLIREGNTAAALGLMGATIGFAIALSRAISVSNGIAETLVWGVIALVVQVAGHYALRLLEPRLHVAIEQGSFTAATMTGGMGIVMGLINAASMTP